MAVRFEIRGNAAVLTISNPPVNVINVSVREGLVAGLRQAQRTGVKRIVIAGEGRAFVAGADAGEFDQPPMAPHLYDILNQIEASPIPCVAAINGVALGGGLELALACRYRIAAPSATLGLPEVKLGLVPGAGGTQRLPRLVGCERALELIPQSRILEADEALAISLIDAVADQPLERALRLDQALLDNATPSGQRMANPASEAAIDKARAQAERSMRGENAPHEAIRLIVLAATADLPQGLELERKTFLSLRGSEQARALRHLFFAERRAMGRVRTAGAAPAHIEAAIVVGGGNMGASIAYALASVGIVVTLVEMDQASSARARKNVARLYEEAAKRGRMSQEAASSALEDRHRFVIGYAHLPEAQIAIEAVFEDMAVKQEVFTALATHLPPQAILATNTSYLDVNEIARGIQGPERVIGLHFFSPAHIMRLLEIVRAARTSEETMASALELARRLNKMPVPSGVCDGFIGNRILTRYRQVTDIVMLEGGLPWQIDKAMRDFGFAMGPYEVQDLSGLDIAYANRKRLGLKSRSGYRYVPIADRLVDEFGRLGRKSGAGWYDYPECGPSQASAQVEQVVIEASRAAGLVRRQFSVAEIQTRALMAMIDEACRILEEGIAEKPEDIDLVLVHGYAFPRWHGGLMHYADSLGAATLLKQLERLAAEDPLSWSVPRVLQHLVQTGGQFKSLSRAGGES